jgi:hypothetical protein
MDTADARVWKRNEAVAEKLSVGGEVLDQCVHRKSLEEMVSYCKRVRMQLW